MERNNKFTQGSEAVEGKVCFGIYSTVQEFQLFNWLVEVAAVSGQSNFFGLC